MTNVRERIIGLARDLGMTTVFGNPGSTELPLLDRFPADLRYVHGLQEASVVGMATGHALLSDRAALVNLHTTAGVGNAMAAIVNAWHAQAPLVITAGNQDRRQARGEPFLWGRQVDFVEPYVKWRVEPARPEDLPEALMRGWHTAMTEPRGPVFISMPMDGFDQPCPPVTARQVAHRLGPDPAAVAEAARIINRGRRVAVVAGAQIDAARADAEVVQLAERLSAAVFMAPLADRWGFPTDHRLFQGHLPPAMGPLAERLAAFDTVLVIGAPVFHYYPYVPGPVVEEGTQVVQLTNDPAQAARALTGFSVVGSIALSLQQLLPQLQCHRRAPPPVAEVPPPPPAALPLPPATARAQLAAALPRDAVVFDEAPGSLSGREHWRGFCRPCSYFIAASGTLGFAMPAAVGAAMARPERPVVCVVGDGSAQYAIQALWSAARYQVPVVFVVLNNGDYAILKAFARQVGSEGVPGLDLPGIDFAGLARGYGVAYAKVDEPDGLVSLLREAVAARRPMVVEVPLAREAGGLIG